MSNAVKCDRCQKCFSPADMDPTAFFMTLTNIYVQGPDDWKNRNFYKCKAADDIDLCPKCTQDFYRFIGDHYIFKFANETTP